MMSSMLTVLRPAGKIRQVNAERSRLLTEYGLTHLRLHGSVYETCIFDDFAALLGLGDPVYVTASSRFSK